MNPQTTVQPQVNATDSYQQPDWLRTAQQVSGALIGVYSAVENVRAGRPAVENQQQILSTPTRESNANQEPLTAGEIAGQVSEEQQDDGGFLLPALAMIGLTVL